MHCILHTGYISDPRGKQYQKRNDDDLNVVAEDVKSELFLRKAAKNHNVNVVFCSSRKVDY
jgi:hypothetical protein